MGTASPSAQLARVRSQSHLLQWEVRNELPVPWCFAGIKLAVGSLDHLRANSEVTQRLLSTALWPPLSGQATERVGLRLYLLYAQSLLEHQCAGGLQKILAMQHRSLGGREVWGKKAKTLDSGCLMLRPCARWGSSTCRACYPPKLNNLNCAIKYFYQICFSDKIRLF